MNKNRYPIPKVTKNIVDLIQQESWGISRPKRVMERIRGEDGENKNIARVIEEISERSNNKGEVIYCATTVYRFIEKAYQLQDKQIPEVTSKTYKTFLNGGPGTVEGEKYRAMIARKLQEYHPAMLDFITNLALKSSDREMIIYIGLTTYGFIEQQVVNNLEQEMNRKSAAEKYEKAAELRDQIRIITDLL